MTDLNLRLDALDKVQCWPYKGFVEVQTVVFSDYFRFMRLRPHGRRATD